MSSCWLLMAFVAARRPNRSRSSCAAGVGAFGALMALHYDFSLIALIGVILLVGIVKKNAIMMIDFALVAERSRALTPEQSIYETCLLRYRPIMMTTMVALLGGLPLALGTGSELRRPLGIAIVGGLLLSQFLMLFTTPVIYIYLSKLGRKFGARRKEPKPTSAASHKDENPAPLHATAPYGGRPTGSQKLMIYRPLADSDPCGSNPRV